MSKTAVVTIASKNYLAHARTLLKSVKDLHDSVDLYLLLVDEIRDEFDRNKEGFTVIEARELCVPDFEVMAFKYNIIEFNTAMKPFFLRYLVEKGYEKVVYLDPDIMVFHKLDPIFNLLDQHSIVLTPHITTPLSSIDMSNPRESVYLANGIYNLGFIALADTSEARDMLDWWCRKCAQECFIDVESGLFVDQKWCEFIPIFYESSHVLRHLGCNMAFWNLHERHLDGDLVNGTEPLVFYHFSGFNPENIKQISKNQDRCTLESRIDLLWVFERYAENLLSNGYYVCKNWHYEYGRYDNGEGINHIARQLYLSVSLDFKNPFSTHPGSFYSLLRSRCLLSKINSSDSGKSEVKSGSKYKSIVNALLRFTARLLGIDRYSVLMNYIHRISVFRNQVFLLKP